MAIGSNLGIASWLERENHVTCLFQKGRNENQCEETLIKTEQNYQHSEILITLVAMVQNNNRTSAILPHEVMFRTQGDLFFWNSFSQQKIGENED